MRGMRWPENIIRFMIDMMHCGGQATVNMMRGSGGISQGAAGVLQWEARNFNIYLPSLTTIKSYLNPELLKFGVSRAAIQKLGATVRAAQGKISKLFCVAFDEVSVKEGAVVRGDKIIGFISGEVKVEDVEEAKANGVLVRRNQMNSIFQIHQLDFGLSINIHSIVCRICDCEALSRHEMIQFEIGVTCVLVLTNQWLTRT